MIENGFVYAVDKSIEKKRKREARQQPKADRFYTICRKYGKAADELDRDELTKTEHRAVVEYLTNVLGYPLKFWPNLE